MGAWERKIGDPWCTQLFSGSGLTIPTSDGTFIPPWSGDNYSSATCDNFTEINSQVDKLLGLGHIEIVRDSEKADLIINPVGAADKKDRGVVLKEKRFYLDCSRHVNHRLPHYKMRLPGYDDALQRLFPGAWLAKVDLSAAFLHVRIDPRYRRILGFQWGGKFYQFTRMMIFGLSTAPAIWQYSMDRVCDYLRSLGLNVIVYLDDFLLISDSRSSYESQLATMFSELASLGLTVNHKKTLGPAQSIHYLGLEIDSIKMQLRVPEYKLLQVRDQLSSFRQSYSASNSAPFRSILSLAGRAASATLLAPSAPPALSSAASGTSAGTLTLNTTSATAPSISTEPSGATSSGGTPSFPAGTESRAGVTGADIISFSDASSHGFGFHSGDLLRFGAWPLSARGRHINWKELRTIELACAEFGPLWSGHRVLFACDNTTAVNILNSGTSRNEALSSIARRIATLAALYDFEFRAVHIPGVANTLADFLSRAISSPACSEWPSLYGHFGLVPVHPLIRSRSSSRSAFVPFSCYPQRKSTCCG